MKNFCPTELHPQRCCSELADSPALACCLLAARLAAGGWCGGDCCGALELEAAAGWATLPVAVCIVCRVCGRLSSMCLPLHTVRRALPVAHHRMRLGASEFEPPPTLVACAGH